ALAAAGASLPCSARLGLGDSDQRNVEFGSAGKSPAAEAQVVRRPARPQPTVLAVEPLPSLPPRLGGSRHELFPDSTNPSSSALLLCRYLQQYNLHFIPSRPSAYVSHSRPPIRQPGRWGLAYHSRRPGCRIRRRPRTC